MTEEMTKTKLNRQYGLIRRPYPKEAMKAARSCTLVTTAMTARMETNIPEAPDIEG